MIDGHDDYHEVSFLGNSNNNIPAPHPSSLPENTLKVVLRLDINSDVSRTQLIEYVKLLSNMEPQIEGLAIILSVKYVYKCFYESDFETLFKRRH